MEIPKLFHPFYLSLPISILMCIYCLLLLLLLILKIEVAVFVDDEVDLFQLQSIDTGKNVFFLLILYIYLGMLCWCAFWYWLFSEKLGFLFNVDGQMTITAETTPNYVLVEATGRFSIGMLRLAGWLGNFVAMTVRFALSSQHFQFWSEILRIFCWMSVLGT